MSATVLLTGGRAPATLDLARFFARAGFRVLTADSLRFPLTRFSRAVTHHARVPAPRPDPRLFLEALRDLVRRHRVDLLVPTCEECFAVAGAPELPSFVEGRERMLEVHSKQRFSDLARALGLPVPPTRRVTSPEEALEACRSGPTVLKPEFSRFASRVLLRPRPEQVRRADIRPERPWVAQAFRPGRIVCTYSVVHQGRLAAHAAYAAEITCGPGSAVVFSALSHPAARDWVRRFAAAVGWTGQLAFDFVESGPGQVEALECNPRSTGGIHLFHGCARFPGAFFEPPAEPLTPPEGALAALTLPALTARSALPLARRLRMLLRARDVAFAREDPGPGIAQVLTLGELAWRALRHRIPLMEASTMDLECNG